MSVVFFKILFKQVKILSDFKLPCVTRNCTMTASHRHAASLSCVTNCLPHLELAAPKESSKACTVHTGTQAGHLSATPTHVQALLHVHVSHTTVRPAALNKDIRSFVQLCFPPGKQEKPRLIMTVRGRAKHKE